MTNLATRPASRLAQLAPLAGAGAALLTVAGYLVIGPDLDSDVPASRVTTYYATHHTHVMVASVMFTYAAILFAVFGAALCTRLRRAALHPLVAGLALVATAVATAGDLANAGSWYVLGDLGGKHTISPAALQTFHIAVSAAVFPEAAGAGVLLLAVAAGGITAAAFPRWMAWSALVLGVVQLLPTPGTVGFLSGLLVLVWMLGAGVSMALRPDDGAALAERSGSSAALPSLP
jgi:hypothetical protein